MNNQQQDGVGSSSTPNNQQPPTSSSTATNTMGPPSASLTASLFAERVPRRAALQTREGTGYMPRMRQRDGYDDVLSSQHAFQNVGKRSGQIIVNTESVDPNAFFEANNNQNFINQQQLHRDDQSSVLSLSNITMNDSDSAMSMLSSKTAATFLSSGDERSPDEGAVTVHKDDYGSSMHSVTSSSEDDQSSTRQTAKLTIKKPASPKISPKPNTPPVSPVLDAFVEDAATLSDTMAPPTPTFDYTEHGGLGEDKEFDDLFEDNTFEQEPKKQKISETKKSKKYIKEISTSEEEVEESEDEEDEESDDREQRRGLKSRQQRRALSSFRASLPSQPETESEAESEQSSQPMKSLEDSGIGPTQLERSNVDLGRDFYRDEEVKLSQKQTALIGEKYIPRKENVKDFEYMDETDDEEANEVNAKVEDDDEDYKYKTDDDEVDVHNTTLVSTQNDDIDNGTDAFGVNSANTRESRLRRKVTKPCKFWENERPLPQEAGKLLKVKPAPIEEPTKKKTGAKNQTKTKRKTDPFNEMTDGVYKVVNEFGEEEEVKIFATAEMYEDSHIRFRKDASRKDGYAAIKTNEESAQLSIYSSLTENGIGVGTMIIKPGGIKPSSNTSTQSEVLYILSGQASVTVHTNPSILMKRGSVIHVPPFNSYTMKNNGKVDCKLLYVFSDTKDRSTEQEEQEESEHEENVGVAKIDDEIPATTIEQDEE